MDPQALLQPRSEDEPSGENLEYDPVFVEMELAAQSDEGSEMGDAVTEGHDPDYKEVEAKALEVLEQSHDLRAAVYLADAALNLRGMAGFAEVTTYIRGCLEQHWATCHPELDADDDNDPTMRINTVQGLCGQPGGQSGPSPVYRSLRRVGLTDSRSFGQFSIRDIEIAEGEMQAPEGMENVPDASSVNAAFRDTDPDILSSLRDAVGTARDDVRAISAVFDTETPGQGPSLDPLLKLLNTIHTRLGKYAGGDVEDPEDAGEETEAAAPAPGAPAPAGGGVPGAIRSPTDVSNTLDRLIDYYRRNEPSSPLPILLERARRLVNADFMTIMRDMAPDGVDNVRTIGGLPEDDD